LTLAVYAIVAVFSLVAIPVTTFQENVALVTQFAAAIAIILYFVQPRIREYVCSGPPPIG
jgi:hypothetical protein